MLEMHFKHLIKKIWEAALSHSRTNDDALMVARDWEFIFKDQDDWVVLLTGREFLYHLQSS